MIRNPRKMRRVRVEVASDPESLEMRRHVGQQKHVVRRRGLGGSTPGPGWMSRAQMSRGPRHTRRLFRSERRAVFGTARIMQDDHGRKAGSMRKTGQKPNPTTQ